MRAVAIVVGLAFTICVAPLAADAQQAEKLPRIGILSPGSSTEPPTVQREPFERGLRELGWTPGSNIIIERRYAEGRVERLPELAAELVRQKVDVIVTHGPQATQAARQARSPVRPGRRRAGRADWRGRPRAAQHRRVWLRANHWLGVKTSNPRTRAACA